MLRCELFAPVPVVHKANVVHIKPVVHKAAGDRHANSEARKAYRREWMAKHRKPVR
jgi:hypothetical protein